MQVCKTGSQWMQYAGYLLIGDAFYSAEYWRMIADDHVALGGYGFL